MEFNVKEIENEIQSCKDMKGLEIVDNKYLSRENGLLSHAMKNLAKIVNSEDKKATGANLNVIKKTIVDYIKQRELQINQEEIERKVQNEKIDVTAPANHIKFSAKGGLHPITNTCDRLKKILHKSGFAIFDGYDIEDTFHNFSTLNTHKLHPARQSQDTIYIDFQTIGEEIRESDYFDSPKDDKDFLLRTHTSAQQIRIAQYLINKAKKEGGDTENYSFKYTTLGPTYRNESDGTHSPMFHQMECVCIGKKIYVQNLIDDILIILSTFFEIEKDQLQIKLRSSYFPFTVPSWEIDIFLPSKNSFVEILGCGMIHPSVIEAMGLDPLLYEGYALGAGIERLCMLKNNISDLRRFFQPEIEYLKSIQEK